MVGQGQAPASDTMFRCLNQGEAPDPKKENNHMKNWFWGMNKALPLSQSNLVANPSTPSLFEADLAYFSLKQGPYLLL